VAGTEGTQPREHPYAVSIAWAPLQAGHTAQAVFALDKARDFASFRTAAQLFDVPGRVQYADVDGTSGISCPVGSAAPAGVATATAAP
jgi:penicillin amidase